MKKQEKLSNTGIAVAVLRGSLLEDKDYYYSWQANIAMSFIDEYFRNWGPPAITYDKLHKVANDAAKNFLDLLIRDGQNA